MQTVFRMKRRYIFFGVLLCFFTVSRAQINELGVFLGGSNYVGDIGKENYIWPNSFAGGLVYKWNMHPRYAIRSNYTYTKLTADDADSDNSFRQERGLDFTNDLHDFAVGIEFNFFKYNLDKLGYTQTPYIILQAGVANYAVRADADGTSGGRTFNFVLPFGLGYKFRLAPNVGVAIESTFRYTFKDDIDGYPYTDGNGVEIGYSNGNDWYVFTGISVVYAFGRPGCYTGSF